MSSSLMDTFSLVSSVLGQVHPRAEASLYHHREGVYGTLLTVRRGKINPSLLGIPEGQGFRRGDFHRAPVCDGNGHMGGQSIEVLGANPVRRVADGEDYGDVVRVSGGDHAFAELFLTSGRARAEPV